jgi:hypothetical protein
MTDLMPWQIHEDLTRERLVLLATLITVGRNNALERYHPEIGDNAWTLGCCGYAYGKHEIIKASGTGQHDWLQLVDEGQQFTFRVGQVPVRFYRGLAEDPHERTLRQAFPEMRQLALALEDGRDLRGMIFRLAVETGLEGEITRIIFLALRGASVECFWPIPVGAKPAVLYPVQESRDEGVALPAPAVRLPRADEDRTKGGGRVG